MLEELTQQIKRGEHLRDDQAESAVEELALADLPVEVKADFLCHLAVKRETVGEIAGFARAMRSRCIKPVLSPKAAAMDKLDVVGTGGDRLSTFNISTTVAIIASAAGTCVAKHGNRASTSLVGSGDVMEALGLPFELGPEEIGKALEQHNFAFFFAPRYHPAFKHIVPARKLCAQRGQPTIFNFLGPLLNPAEPTMVLIGVSHPNLCEPFAQVLQSLGVRRGMVVCGTVTAEDGTQRFLDEFSSLGPTRIAEFYQPNGLSLSTFEPSHFPLQSAHLSDLRGGDREVNARIMQDVLLGKDRGPRRDVVLVNASAALLVAGKARSLSEGWELAGKLIDTGIAGEKLRELQQSPSAK